MDQRLNAIDERWLEAVDRHEHESFPTDARHGNRLSSGGGHGRERLRIAAGSVRSAQHLPAVRRDELLVAADNLEHRLRRLEPDEALVDREWPAVGAVDALAQDSLRRGVRAEAFGIRAVEPGRVRAV